MREADLNNPRSQAEVRPLKQQKLTFAPVPAETTSATKDKDSKDEDPKDQGPKEEDPEDEVPKNEDRTDADPTDEGPTDELPKDKDPKEPGKKVIVIKEVQGNIFNAPDNSILIHACNCQGVWGSGIAAAFRQHYPKASQQYARYCDRGQKAKTGTALLIPPSETSGPRHYIGCVFTSTHYGRRKDAPGKILRNTGLALRELMEQIGELGKTGPVGELRICQINSGAFNVPWERTMAILEGLEVEESVPDELTVFSL